MRFVYDNLAVIYIALVASLMAWLYGGTQSAVLVPVVPWLVLFMVEVLFVFPQKQEDESTYDARRRVWTAMRKDPLVWTAVFLIVLMVVPFVNTGLCVSCDRELIAAGNSPEPAIKHLPFCVNKMQHLNVFFWFITALSAMIATKHCLVSSGKRLLMRMIVWNGSALAVLGFIQTVMQAPGPLWKELGEGRTASVFFSTFGYPNMAGDYFTTIFAIAIALWRRDWDDVEKELQEDGGSCKMSEYTKFWRRNRLLIPAVLAFFAAINTLSRAAMILIMLLLAIFVLHSFFSLTWKMSKAMRFRKGIIVFGTVAVLAFFAAISIPDPIQKEVGTLSTDEILTRVTGKGQYHARVAVEIWKDYPLFGCGGWGYKHFCIPKMTPEELKRIQMIGGINVHNDYLQFLAEHGLVGFAAILAMVYMLLHPVVVKWRKLVKRARFSKAAQKMPRPVEIFALPAPVFSILASAVATVVHGFGDCPLRSPAVLTLFFVSLASLPGFLSKHSEES